MTKTIIITTIELILFLLLAIFYVIPYWNVQKSLTFTDVLVAETLLAILFDWRQKLKE